MFGPRIQDTAELACLKVLSFSPGFSRVFNPLSMGKPGENDRIIGPNPAELDQSVSQAPELIP